MFCKLSFPVAVAVFWLVPVQVMAGGLPRLCLPVDGVTADNAGHCAKLLEKGLDEKKAERVAVLENEGQWYATFYFNREPLALSDIDAALRGSPFSVPRDRLRLFGDVILEVEILGAKERPFAERKATMLAADLAAVKHVSVGEREWKENVLLVTLAMPAPPHFGRQTADFGKNPLSKESFSIKSQPAVKLHDLPSYDALRHVIEKHGANLKGLRWNCLGCRVLGCLTATGAKGNLRDAAIAK